MSERGLNAEGGEHKGVETRRRSTHQASNGAASPPLRIVLDGEWDFLHLVEDFRIGDGQWRKITVPGVWQAQFADLRMRGGTGLYRRNFDLPADWKRQIVFLRFGAVFHIASV